LNVDDNQCRGTAVSKKTHGFYASESVEINVVG
jgi:hypothetical protein